MSTYLVCPNCGHDVARVRSEVSEAHPLDAVVRGWLMASGRSGRFSSAELYREFMNFTGRRDVTARAWGLAMRRCGAIKFKSNGVRGWAL